MVSKVHAVHLYTVTKSLFGLTEIFQTFWQWESGSECHWVTIDGVRNVNFQRGLLCCVGARLLFFFKGEMVSKAMRVCEPNLSTRRLKLSDACRPAMSTETRRRCGAQIVMAHDETDFTVMTLQWRDAQFYWPTLGWGYNNTSLAIITRICGWALGDGRECFITMRTQLSLQLIKGCNWLMHNEKRESTFSKHIIIWVLATFVWVFFSLLPGSLVQGDHK